MNLMIVDGRIEFDGNLEPLDVQGSLPRDCACDASHPRRGKSFRTMNQNEFLDILRVCIVPRRWETRMCNEMFARLQESVTRKFSNLVDGLAVPWRKETP